MPPWQRKGIEWDPEVQSHISYLVLALGRVSHEKIMHVRNINHRNTRPVNFLKFMRNEGVGASQ